MRWHSCAGRQFASCYDAFAKAEDDLGQTLRRTFLVLHDGPLFIDTIGIRNFSEEHVTLPLSLELATTFESMFVLRGSPVGKRGQLQIPQWEGTALRFAYHGADDVLRTLLVEFSLTPVLAPMTSEQSIAHFQLDLPPMATEELMVTCRVDERPVGSGTLLSAGARSSVLAMREAQAAASAALLDGYVRIETPSQGLGEVLARSLTDIALLEVRRGDHRFTTAGIRGSSACSAATACCRQYNASPTTLHWVSRCSEF
jgi:glycogen debranching enzyme